MNNNGAKIIGLITFISAAILLLTGAVGTLAILILHFSHQPIPIPSSLENTIINVAITLLTLVGGYFGIKAFDKNRDFRYFNSLILIALSILTFISVLFENYSAIKEFFNQISGIILSGVIIVIISLSLGLNGYYLLSLDVKQKKKKSAAKGNVFGIFALICASIGLFFIPVLFCPVGIILGVIAYRRGSKSLGITAIVLSVLFLIIGMILGAITYILTHPQTLNQTG